MANDGTGQNWDEARPGNSDPVSPGAQEIRDLRIGNRLRAKKEHVEYAAGTAGGEHKAGSAKAYRQNGFPTKRPDGTTNLDADDNGRMIFRDSNGLWFYKHPDWVQAQSDLLSKSLSYAVAIQSAANGADGGTLTAGTWNTRNLNTVTDDSESIITSLAGGGVQLEAGMYRIRASAPAHQVNGHKIRLFDSTAAAVLGYGTSEQAPGGTVVQTRSFAAIEVVLTVQSVIMIEHWATTTKAGSGGGLNVDASGGETYAMMEIERVQR